jgi:4a-hydroxytetrahydrobiopterin dehydratase
MKPYTNEEIEKALLDLLDWKYADDSIQKKYQFKDFSEALSFILKVGILAEKQNHHPEIWNVYNKVTLSLNTHDANGITDKDFKLAESIDKL